MAIVTPFVQVGMEIMPDEESVIATLPVKSQKIAVSLCKNGLITRIKKDLSEGRNTFAKTGPQFIRESLNMLITGGFTRSELKGRFQKELSWEDTTAASHVSQIVAILLGFRIAQEIDGRVVANPAIA